MTREAKQIQCDLLSLAAFSFKCILISNFTFFGVSWCYSFPMRVRFFPLSYFLCVYVCFSSETLVQKPFSSHYREINKRYMLDRKIHPENEKISKIREKNERKRKSNGNKVCILRWARERISRKKKPVHFSRKMP